MDDSLKSLHAKIKYFSDIYTAHLGAPPTLKFANFDLTIKWNSELEASARKGIKFLDNVSDYGATAYRPFVSKHINFNNIVVHRYYAQKSFFPKALLNENISLNIYSISSDKPLAALVANRVADLGFLKQGNGGTFSLARYRYTSDGQKLDNITDWGLKQFQTRYGKDTNVTKDDVFAYSYGILHDPIYRETYALNLKREFPRLPFYNDFKQWRDWGQALLDLHIGYETAEPYPLKRCDTPDAKARAAGLAPLTKLKSDHEGGVITLDSETRLSGVPAAVWDYKLGNRCAIDWVLDQYKEKTPKDKTIREKFNTYRFADYKEQVVDLLQRVTTVSVRTQEIVEAMRRLDRKAANKPTRDDEITTENADDK